MIYSFFLHTDFMIIQIFMQISALVKISYWYQPKCLHRCITNIHVCPPKLHDSKPIATNKAIGTGVRAKPSLVKKKIKAAISYVNISNSYPILNPTWMKSLHPCADLSLLLVKKGKHEWRQLSRKINKCNINNVQQCKSICKINSGIKI